MYKLYIMEIDITIKNIDKDIVEIDKNIVKNIDLIDKE